MSYNIIGPDVSFYQDNNNTVSAIDFAKMKSNGATFVIIRAGQNKWEDAEFDVSWKNSKGILPRGSYWFYDSRVSPKEQALLWVSILGSDTGELPLWCDFEERYGGGYGGWKNWYNFIEELKRLLPNKQIGIYTGYYYWIEFTTQVGISQASLDYFKQYPLWIANYGTTTPLVPKPWTTWTLWQYTDAGDGSAYGVESKEIDLNYFNGDIDKFNSTFGVTETTPPDGGTEEPTDMIYKITAIGSGLRVRTDHNVYAGVNTSANANDVLTCNQKWVAPADGNEVKAGDTWFFVTHINGVALSLPGWSAYTHKGVPYCKDLVEIPDTVPTPSEDVDINVNIVDGVVRVTVNGTVYAKE